MNELDEDSLRYRTNGHKVKYKYEDYSNTVIVNFYKDQLKSFEEIGLGNETEYGVEVTERLIKRTMKRLDQLSRTTIKTKDKEWRV